MRRGGRCRHHHHLQLRALSDGGTGVKESYRRTLAQGIDCRFVHLRGPIELIRARMQTRSHRYMPASLLERQFATLDPPAGAIEVDIAESTERCVELVLAALTR